MPDILTALTPWLRWLPYGLLPSAPRRPDPTVIEMRLPDGESDWLRAFADETIETVQAWPIDNVLKNFALRAAIWHVTAGEYAAGIRRARTTHPEMRQWIDQTRSLADRLPFGGPSKDAMTHAAAQMEGALEWPARHFQSWPPSVETKADADWRVSLNLWAADRLMRALNELEADAAAIRQETDGESGGSIKVPPTKFWSAMFSWCPPDRLEPAFAEYKEAQKRVGRFDQTIKPEMRETLMIELLRDVLQNGHFRPDERPPFDPHVH